MINISNMPYYFSRLRGLILSRRFGFCGKGFVVCGKMHLTNPKYISIGERVKIGPYSRLEVTNYTDTYLGTIITIGDGTSIEHAVHVYGTIGLKIGSNCMIASGCMITDNNHGINLEDGIYKNQKLTSECVQIGNNCWLGENVCVLPGVSIGDNCIIGCNSVVAHSIPEYSIAVGSPARVIKKYDQQIRKWIII